MTACPHCGSQLRSNAHFCALCGKAVTLPQPAALVPDPANGVCAKGHSQARPNVHFCYVCGAPVHLPNPANGVCANCHPQIRPDARFCYRCGAPVTSSLAPDPVNGVCQNGHPQVRASARHCYQCGAPVNPSSPQCPHPSGPVFNGRYQVIGEVGRGGMGSIVYKVQDLQTPGRMLALKEMDETLLPAKDRPDIVKAFQREADLLKRLDHPHIVKVYDSFQESEKHYMAMDLVQGRTLEKMMETSPGGFPEARVLPWAEQLCDTLEYLHNLNPPIIYRDMKPGNVMVEDASGQIKVVDFGIAREFKGGKKKGDTIKFGTDGYAPPEQYTDSKGETRPCSDVYALAAMLYHLISGDDPTSHPFKFDFLLFHRPPVSASKHVVDALTKALEMEMGKRFQTMAEFKAALTGQAAPKAKKKSAGPAAQAGPSSQGQPIISPPSFAPPVPAPPRAVGGLQVSTSRIDMSRVEKGGIPPVPQSFTVSLPGGDVAQVSAQDAWLTVSPATAGDKQSVEVSVRTDMLTLDSPHWDAPNILKPFVVTALAAAISAWWISVPVLIAGIWWRWIWQGLALIFGGAAGIQLTMWLVSWLLPHTIARPADHTGSVIVSDGPVKNTITIKATAVPSTWRRVMGWSTMALATVAETGISTGALWWLIEGLGRWWR